MNLRSALRKMAQRLVRRAPLSYHEIHVAGACDISSGVRGKSVLVVGAAGGSDCKLFIDRGAAEVTGLDVHEDIGSDFSDQRVTYHRASIEGTALPSNSFDLVFATATMEHVHNIEAGFAEMVRLTKPGGAVFSIAAPLWNSAYGHHMGCFHGHPWVHLAIPEDDIPSYAREHGITENLGVPIESVARYMMHPDFFNRRPAADYISAASNIPGLTRLRNVLHKENDTNLFLHPLAKIARQSFSDDELMSVTHEFSARKSTA